MDAKEQIKAIRKFIKAHCPTVSVTMGKGTAWGWVDIHCGGRMFTESERDQLKAIDLVPGGNWALISPDNRKDYAVRSGWKGA